MNKTIIFKLLILVFNLSLNYSTVSLGQTSSDSTGISAPTPYELTDINYEIEQTQKKLNKMQYGLAHDATVARIDTALNKYVIFLNEQANEFSEYNPNNLSKFFLENTYRSWEGFNSKLHGWRTDINNRIVIVQNNIDDLDKKMERWELTGNNKKIKEEPVELISRISKVIESIGDIRKRFVKKSGN